MITEPQAPTAASESPLVPCARCGHSLAEHERDPAVEGGCAACDRLLKRRGFCDGYRPDAPAARQPEPERPQPSPESPAAPGPPPAELLGAALARLLGAKGVAPVPPGDGRPRCRICGLAVPQFGQLCPGCERTDRLDFRRGTLRRAYDSLPPWDWCRLGTSKNPAAPEFTAAVKRAGLFVEAVKRWTRASGNLLLLGPTGVGKTACAVALAHRILDQARDDLDLDGDRFRWAAGVLFVPAVEIAEARREAKLGETPRRIADATAASLLILDELGFLDDDRDGAIARILEARYRAGKSTVVTSGLGMAGLRARYGEATIRKIAERGQCPELDSNGAA